MNTINDPKPSKKVFLLTLLAIFVVGIPLTVLALQKQQIFKQFAWSTTQTAAPKCIADTGKASIQVTFSNTESSKSMDVIAQDLQTGNLVNLGTIKANKTATDTILTDEKSLKAGSILFTLKWSDGSTGTDTRTATYKSLASCTPPPAFCPSDPTVDKGLCQWDAVVGATGYTVEIIDSQTGDLISSDSVPAEASESAFTMQQGKTYTCSVKPFSACSQGRKIISEPKTCTPTVPMCPAAPQKLGQCSWDPVVGAKAYNVTIKETTGGTTIKSETVKSPETSLSYTADPLKTYQCTVSASNICSDSTPIDSPPYSCTQLSPTPSVNPSPSGSPSPSVIPSVTSLPSVTPLPSPTLTPTPTPTMTPTPTLTPTPRPSATPYPTLTPYVIVRTVQNTIVQQPQPRTVTTQPNITQQPVQITSQPQSTQGPQPTAAPKVKPTGNITNALILVGTSTVLVFVGGILFFLL